MFKIGNALKLGAGLTLATGAIGAPSHERQNDNRPETSSIVLTTAQTARIGQSAVRRVEIEDHYEHQSDEYRLPLNTPYRRASFIYNYTTHHGLTRTAALAGLGNFEIEDSALSPSIENGLTVGIAQWEGSRREALMTFSADRHMSALSLQAQVEFEVYELDHGYSAVRNMLNTSTNLVVATNDFMRFYEVADPASGSARDGAAIQLSHEIKPT